MTEMDEIIVGIVVGVISSCITALIITIITQSRNKRKLIKEGLKVFMIRKDHVIETHFIPLDSKIFPWNGGHYNIREEQIASAMIGLDKPEITSDVVNIDKLLLGKHKLGMREIF